MGKTNHLHCYYDEGWNARCRDEPFDETATEAWRDGWLDCHEAMPCERKEM